jgi:SAM-dependent methyltransferase
MGEAGVAATEPVIGGNVYPKYTTRNPLARRLVAAFLASLEELVGRSGARALHEVGCGEGHLSMALASRGLDVRASDLSPAAIATARRLARARGLAIDYRVADLYDLEPEVDGAELVVCCEVLEHVPDPERALAVLGRLARPHVIISVPREPLWRLLNMARGRYWPAFGNTPGHLQHWSTARFVRTLARHFEVVDLRTPLPWTMALCRRRGTPRRP